MTPVPSKNKLSCLMIGLIRVFESLFVPEICGQQPRENHDAVKSSVALYETDARRS